MDTQKLDALFAHGDRFIRQLTEERLDLLRMAHERGSARAKLEEWEDLGKFEQSVQWEYSERYLFELLQNANDAIKDWIEKHPGEENQANRRVCLVLTWNALLVANTGEPFYEDNVRSICRLGKTTKSASKHVGHKGIGFKSVLGITEMPEIYSGRYAFGFSRRDCEAAIRDIIGDDGDVDFALPIHRFPFQRKLQWVLSEERSAIESLFADGYVTVIHLPLSVETDAVEQRMRTDLTPKVLLFLDAIQRLELVYPTGERTVFWRQVVNGETEIRTSYQVSLWADCGEGATVDSSWLILRPDQVGIPDRKQVARFGEAWKEVEQVGFSVAFPLDKSSQSLQPSDQSYPFYVYFPTEEDSGFQFLIQADFYTGASRTHIPDEEYNRWLGEQLALYLADKGVEELTYWFPDDPAIVDILAPVRDTHGAFDAYFRAKCLEWLRAARFVPLGRKRYETPEKIRLTPKGAEIGRFREFFFGLHHDRDWGFPLEAVEKAETRREGRGRDFLLKIGTTRLSTQEALDTVSDGPTIAAHDCGPFFAFLTKWWESLPLGRERDRFVAQLKGCRLVPTTRGWKRSDEGRIFQGLGDEQVIVPEGFPFDVVNTVAYGEPGQTGPQYRLLKEMGVAEYRSREIVRQAIVPTLESPESLEQLPLEAIAQAYLFLKNYLETRRGGDRDVDNLMGAVLLPAIGPVASTTRTWQRADELYFSQYWTGSDDLETIYGQFEDVYFLGQPEFLGGLSETDKHDWYSFFAWLGVNHTPRLLRDQYLPGKHAAPYEFNDILTQHPHAGALHWQQYLEQYSNRFVCDTPGHAWKTYRLVESSVLHKFDDLVARGDPAPLIRLFRLLGRFWGEKYQSNRMIMIQCSKTKCARTREIEAYFHFALREIPWVPAMIPIEGQPQRLLPPREVWVLGEAEPPTVQQMVPVLPEHLRTDSFAAFFSEVGIMSSTRATFSDYLALLQRLPSIYALERPGLDASMRNTWQNNVRAVFNWLCERMNTIISGHRGDIPDCPRSLQVLAFRGDDQMCYASLDQVVYPDDPYLDTQWADTCTYLRIDEDYVPLRNWFAVGNLSTQVDSLRKPSPDLPDATLEMRARYQSMLPYFLALVEEKQPSKYERQVFPRLQRLEIHVVTQLTICQTLQGSDHSKEFSEDVYLHSKNIDLPTGLRARGGDLYIRQSALPNWDLLGEPVAAYIEIKGLADAFITLFSRDDDGRRRFLEAKGIPAERYEHACRLLGQSAFSGQPPEAVLDEEMERLRRQIQEGMAATGASGESQLGDEPRVPDSRVLQGKGLLERKDLPAPVFDFPGFDFEDLHIVDYTPGSGKLPTKGSGRGDGKGGEAPPPPVDWAARRAWDAAVGKRGEEFVYRTEQLRLQAMGVAADVHLKWVSAEYETADHDFLSVDEKGHLVLIEVKASAGAGEEAHISKEQFERAVREGAHYWLYYVTHVATASPVLHRYRNLIQLWLDKEIALRIEKVIATFPRVATSI